MDAANKVISIDPIEIAFTIVLFLLLAGTVVTCDLFAGKTLFPFYAFTIGTGVVSFITAIAILKKRKDPATFSISSFIAGGPLLIYLLIQYYFHPAPKGIFLISSCLFFLSCTTFLAVYSKPVSSLLKCIILIAILESFICLLQWTGIITSFNPLFKVTGTYLNPNVTAMFIAMSFPACILYKNKKIGIIVGCFLFTAILLLQCRTAIAGIAAGAIPLLLRNNWFRSFFSSFNLWMKSLFITLILLIISTAGIFMYLAKKDSADGRIHIWKIAVAMISENPIHGCGFGLFEKNYNLFQIKHNQQTGSADTPALQNQFVEMVYNDYLELIIEGGIIGLLLWTGLLFFIVKKGIGKTSSNRNSQTYLICLTGVTTFITMMFVNFSIQAIPAFLIFLFYSSWLYAEQINKSKSWAIAPGVGIFFFFSGILLFINQSTKASASYKHGTAISMANAKQFEKAIQLEKSVKGELNYYESFWKAYGAILIKTHRYEEALDCYRSAMSLSSNPSIMAGAGSCCLRLKKHKDAISYFKIATAIDSKKISYKEGLMMSYYENGDSAYAIRIAQEIMSSKPYDSNNSKEKAKTFLNRIRQ